VLPSARIFASRSAYIKPEAYSTLYLVTKYINRFTKILVKVAGYTADTASKDVDLSLSKEQADAVSKFLWESGLNVRLLYATGNGGIHLVTKNTFDWDSDNYRIEITLEKLYV